jgi:hypothetical protein
MCGKPGKGRHGTSMATWSKSIEILDIHLSGMLRVFPFIGFVKNFLLYPHS